MEKCFIEQSLISQSLLKSRLSDIASELSIKDTFFLIEIDDRYDIYYNKTLIGYFSKLNDQFKHIDIVIKLHLLALKFINLSNFKNEKTYLQLLRMQK